MAGRGRSDGSKAAARSAAERLRSLDAGPVPPGWSETPTEPLPELPTEPLPANRAPRAPGRLVRRWVPAGWRGARVDPGRPGAVALAAVAAIAAVVAAVGVWWDRPVAESAPALPPVLSPAGGTFDPSTPPTSGPGALLVSVSGKVTHPGLVHVPDGARVADVLAAAGGPLPGVDVSGLNLARKVADGEQVVVGAPAPVDPAGSGAAVPPGSVAGAGIGTGGKIDLNLATLQQLDGLPGVGPVTAQRILDWRSQHGRFTKVEQLREVDGIGERRFGQLRTLLTV